MKRICQQVQQTLGELGPVALREDEAAQLHLEDCEECFTLLESMARLDEVFEVMPALDASDDLVEQLLARDELQLTVEPSQAELITSPQWRTVLRDRLGLMKDGLWRIFGPGQLRLKASMALVALILVSSSFYLRQMLSSDQVPAAVAPGEQDLDKIVPEVEEVVFGIPEAAQASKESRLSGETSGGVRQELGAQLEGLGTIASDQLEPNMERDDEGAGNKIDVTTVSGSRRFTSTVSIPQSPPPPPPPSPSVIRGVASELGDDDSPVWVGTEMDPSFRDASARVESEVSGAFDDASRDQVHERLRERLDQLPRRAGKDGGAAGRFDNDSGQATKNISSKGDKEANVPVDGVESLDSRVSNEDVSKVAVGKSEVAERRKSELAKPRSRVAEEKKQADLSREDPSREDLSREDLSREQAQNFLAERERIDDLSFQPATGYWSNTYVPGDPALRHLQARLAGRDRAVFETASDTPLRLHDAARRTTQPFDPPTDAALAVVLNADRRGVRDTSRLLLQVGLVGTERHGGRRPGMNVALVVDLSSATAASASAASLRALIVALSEARDLGDRFRLIVAGPLGGEILGPGDFKHGPLTVAMQQLFPAAGITPSGEPMELVAAVRLAYVRVSQNDDPSAPLGSSAVIMATPDSLGGDLSTLVELAHAGAVAGVPLSAVGVGDAAQLDELDRLALAGQGNRRLMRQPEQALGLVDRELSAVARVVARAVRLRIGLAPGVRLVDVVGARRFGAADAEKVRRAERSIDQRLARNLGIEADRGDDEPGIQIVLPTFYAGDRHVILLDLVVPGPGPVAEVTARFKDLAHLGNGVAQASLEMPRRKASRGPLERNVLENLLAHRLRGVLDAAGRDVASGNRQAAHHRLAAHRRLLAGLGEELRGFHKDRDLMGDIAMLDEYLQLLGAPTATEEQRVHLAESLRYAARLKVLPAPQPMGGSK